CVRDGYGGGLDKW
nr:immunoglobulin heavy chain junction region [Macaca mulatta]MOY20799.1 immunoglobulin heavy chain junction region [Macaca mulatta]